MARNEKIFTVKTTLSTTELRAQLKKKDKAASVTTVGRGSVKPRKGMVPRRKVRAVSIMV